MYKMAVVGDYDSIYGFAALGLDTFPADGPEKLEQVFHNLVSGGYAVIYMTEAAAAKSAAQWSGTEKACFRRSSSFRECPETRARGLRE